MINVYCSSKRFAYLSTCECNTCVSVCDVNADWEKTLGSYRCSCRAGFSGDGHTCKDKKRIFIRKRTVLIKQLSLQGVISLSFLRPLLL